jgi:uncharacterized lipoprotein YajG
LQDEVKVKGLTMISGLKRTKMAAAGLTLYLAGILLLSGCAFSPQSIKLAPVLPVAERSIGQGRSFQLTVSDLRVHAALGSRGGIYADSSQIQLANRLDQASQRALHQGFLALGFLPYTPISVPVYASGADPLESIESTEELGLEALTVEALNIEELNVEELNVEELNVEALGSDERAVVDRRRSKADVAIHVDWIDLQYGSSNPFFPSKVEMLAVLKVHVETEFGSFQNQYQRANKMRFLTVPDQQQNQHAVNELLAQLLQQVLTDPRLNAVLAP